MAFILANWRIIAEAVVIGILLLTISVVTIQRNHARNQRDALQVFKTEAEALGRLAEAKAKAQEAANEKRITIALSGRDAALKRLSDERASRRVLPFTGSDTTGSGKVCYDRAAFESALQRFAERTAGLIDEGDAALINGRALVEAWPRP